MYLAGMARTKQFNEQEVLEKAMKLFWRKGFNGTSMQDLVDELGISRASLYDTFGSKQELYFTALNEYRKQSGQQQEEILCSQTSIKQQILCLLEQAIAMSLQDLERKGCFMVNCTVELANQDEKVAAIANQNLEGFEKRMALLIEQGQQQGEINTKHSPKALARYLFTIWNGLQVVSKIKPDADVLNDVKKVAIAALD